MEEKPNYYFKKISEFCFPEIFGVNNVWKIFSKKEEILSKINSEIKGTLGKNVHVEGTVFIGEKSRILHNSIIEGPVYIGKNTIIGPNAHIRGGTIIGENCKIGKTEVKGSIIMNNVRADHLGYVGDSILGDSTHLGAGAVAANLRFDGKEIENTEMKKSGVILGDNSQLGVNSTTLPGTLIGQNSLVYPGVVIGGFVPSNHIVKPAAKPDLITRK